MKEDDDAFSRRTQEVMARVEAAIQETHENLKRVDERLARISMNKSAVNHRLSLLSSNAREHILGLGMKFARRDIASPAKQIVAEPGVSSVAAPKLPKVPRNMI